MVFFTEGGGGRAGTGGNRTGEANGGDGNRRLADRPLVTPTFASMARLTALVPLVGITSRLCFAGNAAAARLLRRDHRHRRTRTSAWAARP